MSAKDRLAPAVAPDDRDALWPNALQDEQRAPVGLLILLTLAAAAFRAIALNQQLWYDEISTLLEYVRLPLRYIVTTYTSQNQHLLYSILARFSVVSLGEAPWALRLPAMLLGVLCVPAAYYAARRLTSRSEALGTALLLTVSYHHVWFSQNARGYTGLALATLLSTLFFLRGAREGLLRHWLWYGIFVALGMYVHLSMGFIVAGHGLLYLLLLGRRLRAGEKLTIMAWLPMAGFSLAALLTVALYAPVLPEMLERTVGGSTSRGAQEVARAEWRSPVWLLLETIRGLAGNAGAAGVAAFGGAAVLGFLGLWSYWRQDGFAVGLILLPCVVTALLMLALSRNLWPRFFFFAIAFAFLFVVRGAAQLSAWAARQALGPEARGRKLFAALLALMVLGSAWQMRAAWIYPKQDYQGAMKYVEEHTTSEDAVVLVGLTVMPYQRFYGRDWPAAETPEELAAVRARSREVRALYTLPIFVESRYPELWNTLSTEFTTEKVFRGTMGGGEIYVARLRRDPQK